MYKGKSQRVRNIPGYTDHKTMGYAQNYSRNPKENKMKGGNIKDIQNGEPYIFKEDTVKNHIYCICCDCGLIHFIHVGEISKGRLPPTGLEMTMKPRQGERSDYQ